MSEQCPADRSTSEFILQGVPYTVEVRLLDKALQDVPIKLRVNGTGTGAVQLSTMSLTLKKDGAPTQFTITGIAGSSKAGDVSVEADIQDIPVAQSPLTVAHFSNPQVAINWTGVGFQNPSYDASTQTLVLGGQNNQPVVNFTGTATLQPSNLPATGQLKFLHLALVQICTNVDSQVLLDSPAFDTSVASGTQSTFFANFAAELKGQSGQTYFDNPNSTTSPNLYPGYSHSPIISASAKASGSDNPMLSQTVVDFKSLPNLTPPYANYPVHYLPYSILDSINFSDYLVVIDTSQDSNKDTTLHDRLILGLCSNTWSISGGLALRGSKTAGTLSHGSSVLCSPNLPWTGAYHGSYVQSLKFGAPVGSGKVTIKQH